MSDPKPEWHDAETRMGDVGATAVRSPSSSSSAAPSPAPAPASQGTIGGGSFFSAPLFAMGTILANRYEILQVLGQGGMGAVYKVYDRELERFVALKTIRPELAGHAEMLARFKQELILARQVAHRNIVRLYDIAEGNGVKFITMEYVEGEDFRSILRREGKLSTAEAIDVIRQICFALQAAHAEGVIHRDLKPQNIMRDKQGRVIVMDFGLARALESDGMTQTGALLGTMEYMSPEQSRGEQVDCTSDIYAAGLIFYELLTGKMPYAAESALASLMKRAQQRAIPAAEIDRGVPRNLSSIVSHCIEPDKKKRYQSASEILVDLEAADPTARTAVSYVIPRPAHHTPAIYKWAGLAGIVLIVGVSSFFGWKKFSTPNVVNHPPVSVLVADFENHTGDPVFDGTLEPMFNAALEDAKFINAFSRGSARKLAAQLPNHPGNQIDEQAARLIAQGQGINAVITGSISRRGDNEYKISVEAIDGSPSGKTLASNEITAQGKDQVMLKVPELVAPIRAALGDTTPESVQLAATQGSFKVANLEAAHQYGIGMEQQFAGKVSEAFDSFSKAAALDSDFGRAYSGMAAAARNLGRHDEAEKDFKLALQHMDRMTERERYRVRGLYYTVNGNYSKCVEEYDALTKEFPSDNVAYINLAVCYERLRDMTKAVEVARHTVEMSPEGVVQRLNLAVYSSYAGDFAGAEKEAREVLRRNPTYEVAFTTLGDALIGQGKVQDATDTYNALAKLGKSGVSSAALGLAEVAVYSGQFNEAVRILNTGAASDLAAGDKESAADKLASLAYAQLSAGQSRQATDSAARALANSKRVSIRFLAARVFAEAGSSARAQELATGLKSELLIDPQTYGKIVEGQIAIQQNDLQRAIQTLSDANKMLNTWIGHYDLGRAYLAAGMFTEANSEFDICIKRRGESLELMDEIPTYGYFPPVYYYQGRALEGLKSQGFTESLRMYLTIRGQSSDDSLAVDARHRLPFSRQ